LFVLVLEIIDSVELGREHKRLNATGPRGSEKGPVLRAGLVLSVAEDIATESEQIMYLVRF
jgi:hypothetical protein